MTLNELDFYFNSFLKKENFPADPSRNGIQITNADPDGKKITKVAFAVDACLATVEKAAALGAQLLFVHHGLFWGSCDTVTGNHYMRIASFIKHDIALYASHIPLDANPEVGNNYGLAKRIGLDNLKPFGEWRGMSIGVRGLLHTPVTLTELAQKSLPEDGGPFHLFPFGKNYIHSVAIITGGAGEDAVQAAAAGVDAYITGEVGHENYHPIEEYRMNVIAGGHYQTETIGVNLVKNKLEREKGLETVFIDIPTGL
jgi:dinuclear metal center YbgI/SA1388 family protein